MNHLPLRGIVFAAILSLLSGISIHKPAAAQGGAVLTGTVRLACEAILCLSSSVRPGECTPSLNHYFGILIYGKYGIDWPATIAARHAFLSTCPVVSSPGMPELIQAIASGAGRCDADTLNKRLKKTAYAVKEDWLGGDAGSAVTVREFQAISDAKPLYCLAYDANEYTMDQTAKYVGDPFRGGKWVDARNYESAFRAWKAAYASQDDEYTYSWEPPYGSKSGNYDY